MAGRNYPYKCIKSIPARWAYIGRPSRAPIMQSVEAVEKPQSDQILIGFRKQTRSRLAGMPRFKRYNYDQDAMVVINYQE